MLKYKKKIRRFFHKHKWRVGALIMERCKYALPIGHCKGCDSYVLVHPVNPKRGHRLYTNPLDIYPMADGIVWKVKEIEPEPCRTCADSYCPKDFDPKNTCWILEKYKEKMKNA